jgi:hypothetical protein
VYSRMTGTLAVSALALASLAFLQPLPARAEDDAPVASVMFNAREVSAVEKALKGRTTPPLQRVWLESILYVDNSDWTIWINGHRLSPSAKLDGADILEVAPNFVRVRAIGSPVSDIRLLPDQTLMVASGEVVNGVTPQYSPAALTAMKKKLPPAVAALLGGGQR